MTSANMSWLDTIEKVLVGQIVMARGLPTRELLHFQSKVLMCDPLVTIMERKLSYRFAAAEALWILTGDNRLQPLVDHAPSFGRFSDDGRTLSGAYGPKVVTQLQYVVDALQQDEQSRQAVMTTWRECPRPSKDIPCTISLQFLIRCGKIHCIVNMRSSDVWLGWPYDIFSFTMITCMVGLLLTQRTSKSYQLGTLVLNAGSQHIYEPDQEKACNIVFDAVLEREISPLILSHLNSPDHLLVCLGSVRDDPRKECKVEFFHEMGFLAI